MYDVIKGGYEEQKETGCCTACERTVLDTSEGKELDIRI